MSRSLVQPIGQKRLTNVAVVRLKKCGIRFEVACYKNKVLSWRSGVEKDLDEVLQSHTVYTNVSKGILAKSKDLLTAFDTEDQSKICLEILKKGKLQVAGKERDSQLSNQFRDIATIVMQKTINTETRRPYTISMIERLMHEIHFSVDPNSTSKKQALEVISELQKHFPIKRSPMKLRLTARQLNAEHKCAFLDELAAWNANILSKEESGDQLVVVCELDPSYFRDCNTYMRNSKVNLEVLSVYADVEGSADVDSYDDVASTSHKDVSSVEEVSHEVPEALSLGTKGRISAQTARQYKCGTCNIHAQNAEEYRSHCKSGWHKHNLSRKTKQLPPLSEEEYTTDADSINTNKADAEDYNL